ncbi:hypothetical protein PoB_007002800 [Plakobranchus ocellatus]|uniref:EGF-like domain-containing protein n=1 Tax=Plakobranchus ocellatus TaxID=259542 RepID=A0AAV4DHJ6_9GAST|nr:hypothetical protein PoB_007002800 [Plakobranchus ocellatus]
MNLSSQTQSLTEERNTLYHCDRHRKQNRPEIMSAMNLQSSKPSSLSAQSSFTETDSNRSSASKPRFDCSEKYAPSAFNMPLNISSNSVVETSSTFSDSPASLCRSEISPLSLELAENRNSTDEHLETLPSFSSLVCSSISENADKIYCTNSLSPRVVSLFSKRSRSVISFFKPPRMMVVAALLLAIISLQTPLSDARSVGVCRGIPCANGGRLLVSNSIWGNCRCRCPSGFVGPYCQYQQAYKRNGNAVITTTASPRIDGDRLYRSHTMELIRQHLLALQQMPIPTPCPNDIAGNENENEETSTDNITRREADLSLLEMSKLAALVSSGLLDSNEFPAPFRMHRNPRISRAKRTAESLFWYRR